MQKYSKILAILLVLAVLAFAIILFLPQHSAPQLDKVKELSRGLVGADLSFYQIETAFSYTDIMEPSALRYLINEELASIAEFQKAYDMKVEGAEALYTSGAVEIMPIIQKESFYYSEAENKMLSSIYWVFDERDYDPKVSILIMEFVKETGKIKSITCTTMQLKLGV